MDLCCEYPFPSFTINDDTADTDRLVLAPDGIQGLDGGPIRRQVDPAGQEDGGLVHGAFLAARIVTWKGALDIQTAEWTGGPTVDWLTAVNTLQNLVTGALNGILNSSHTLNWTPTGLGAHSLGLKYGMPGGELQFGGSMKEPTFTFQTVSEDPVIIIGT